MPCELGDGRVPTSDPARRGAWPCAPPTELPMNRTLVTVVPLVLALGLVACGPADPSGATDGGADAGPVVEDGGSDAGVDGGTDAGVDAGTDGGSADTTAPRVVSIEPADGAADVPLDAAVRVTFSEAVDCDSAAAIELVEWWDGNPQGAPLDAARTCDGAVVTLTPAALFGIGDEYKVTVGAGVTDLAGNHLAQAASAVFDCAWVSPENTPKVVSTWPADGDTGVATTAAVEIVFSKTMRQSTVSAPAVTLAKASGGDAVTVQRETFQNPVFVLRPQSPLAAHTEYVLSIAGGAGGVEDEAGNLMTGDVEVRFTTGDAPAPELHVVSVSPADGAVDVDHTTRVTVTFDAPVDPSSVFLSYPGTAGTFRVSPYADLSFPVEGRLDFADPTAVSFDIDPATTYELERTYHLRVTGGASGARSLAGGRLAADFDAVFTTKSPVDATLADVRAADGVCALRVHGVYMTFFRDQPSSHKGFFVQQDPAGPAIFVLTYNRNPLFPVYPWYGATGFPKIDLTVTRVDTYEGMKQVSAWSMTRVTGEDADLPYMMETMVQKVGDADVGPDEAAELLQIDGTLTNYRPGGSAENREYDLTWGTNRKVTLKVSQFGIAEPLGLGNGSKVRVTAALQHDDKGFFVKPYGYFDEAAHTQAELADPANYDLMLDIVNLAD